VTGVIWVDPGSSQGHKWRCIKIIGASQHNLKNVNVEFPLGKFIAITGVSGSGKSTLIRHFIQSLAQQIYDQRKARAYKDLTGTENVDKVVMVDQSPIGNSRSNPATYMERLLL
jgi:excinuclease ABC subunit A